MGAAVTFKLRKKKEVVCGGVQKFTQALSHEMNVFSAPPQVDQVWRVTRITEVYLQILACLPLLTLPNGCNNKLLVHVAALCEVTQQGICSKFFLGHMPMVGPQQRLISYHTPLAHQVKWLL